MKTLRLTAAICAGLVVAVSGAGILHGQEHVPEPPVFTPEAPSPFQVTPEPAQAAVITVDGIGVDADEIRFDRRAGVLEAKGSVTLTVPVLFYGRASSGIAVYRYSPGQKVTRTIRAEDATINQKQRVIEAVGNVRVSLSDDDANILEAPEITLRYQGPLTNVVRVRR